MCVYIYNLTSTSCLLPCRCPAAKDYFKDLSGHWSWAVQWLQKKVGSKHNSDFGKNPSRVSSVLIKKKTFHCSSVQRQCSHLIFIGGHFIRIVYNQRPIDKLTHSSRFVCVKGISLKITTLDERVFVVLFFLSLN